MNYAKSLGTALVLVFLCAGMAAAMQITGVEVKDYGLFAYDEKAVEVETPKPSGETKLSNIRLVERTTTIPMAPNTFFSMDFLINSKPQGQQIEIELRVKNPKGETSKGTLNIVTGQVTTTTIEFGDKDPTGAYVLSIHYKDKELLSKELKAYRP